MRSFLPKFAILAALALPLAAHADSLIINGGFETGDFTGYTQSGNLGATFVSTGQNGTDAAYLGPVGSDGYLSQTFSDVTGQAYSFGFNLFSNGSGYSDFSALVDGTAVLSIGNAVAAQSTDYLFSFTGTGSDTVTFGFRNDPNYLQLDNISVSAVGPLVSAASLPVAATPEPNSLILLGSGALGLAGAVRRRVKA